MSLMSQKQSVELLEAEANIWNHVLNFINSMSLKCATELGIPDIIHKHGRPITLVELVDALPDIDPAKADCISRLMQILLHSKLLTMEKINHDNSSNDDQGYSLTPASLLLVEDHPLSMKPYVLSQLDPFMMDPWHHLSRWFKNIDDRTAFHTANNGMSFWEKKQHDPRFSRCFDQGMETDTPMVANVIKRDCRQVFEGLDSLVDVGGGTEGTTNLKYVEGDMFKYIPPSDAVLFKWILHDWSDEESVQILKNCKKAITDKGKRGKVIIIDMVVDDRSNDHKSVETQLFFDMLMMTLFGGRERKEKNWARLLSDAGFTDYRISPLLGVRSIIEVYP
ncbi:hypothetical protein BUALT_Bualt19G0046000 [Buddleja alternifolia]|uniref:Uncharacterized protein n=1 Tax=Buddleja alternifolia TaxID=168488 RepID=A0AAV6W7E3_9LAMI|nr:hypothetical protein BUALT_Bualt19G0046000 [Buddleja alternifolia]